MLFLIRLLGLLDCWVDWWFVVLLIVIFVSVLVWKLLEWFGKMVVGLYLYVRCFTLLYIFSSIRISIIWKKMFWYNNLFFVVGDVLSLLLYLSAFYIAVICKWPSWAPLGPKCLYFFHFVIAYFGMCLFLNDWKLFNIVFKSTSYNSL